MADTEPFQNSEEFVGTFIQKESIHFVVFSCMWFLPMENFDEMKD